MTDTAQQYYLCADINECQDKLDQIAHVVAAIAGEYGYTVTEDGKVIGKNVVTGEDDPNSITTKWHDPILLNDGTYGIMSLRERLPTHYEQVELGLLLGEPVDNFRYVEPEEEEEP